MAQHEHGTRDCLSQVSDNELEEEETMRTAELGDVGSESENEADTKVSELSRKWM